MLLGNEDSDSEVSLTINEDYAKKYDRWRKNEELQKLKDKYGSDFEDNEESSSTDDDNDDDNIATNLSAFDKDFFKTLSCLKKKDPKIYDKDYKFFNDNSEFISTSKKEKSKKPTFLRDYERKIITERGGKVSDDEADDKKVRPESPTIVEINNSIKEKFKQFVNAQSSDEENENDGLDFVKKSDSQVQQDDNEYLKWLKGERDNLSDKATEKELKPLRELWTDKQLEENEKFLRDYILNKRFLEQDDDDHAVSYNEIVHDSDENISEDERNVTKQEEFEHKYNFRFEEPDTEFIKRYPRTLQNTLRRKDNRRAQKRAEIKERKEAEKLAKREELKQLKALKRKEILEKIEKLKLITGNDDIEFQHDDFDEDFDPEKHDKRMKELFNDNYYAEEDQNNKPVFPDIDEELEIENWEKWQDVDGCYSTEQNELHCEDPDFNMDCDYNPKAQLQAELIESTRKKRRKKQSKLAEILSKPKPVFNPAEQTYEDYFDEYYKLDCEDFIGDLPCRFKYRKAVPNDFGLTIDEILKADDKELNRWCSLKKAVQQRPEEKELYDVTAYKKKAANEQLKRKILASLYAVSEENIDEKNTNEISSEESVSKKNKKKKGTNLNGNVSFNSEGSYSAVKVTRETKKKGSGEASDKAQSEEYLKEQMKESADVPSTNTNNLLQHAVFQEKQKSKELKKRKRENEFDVQPAFGNNLKKEKYKKAKTFPQPATTTVATSNKKFKYKNKVLENKNAVLPDISDTRLKAYGLNPKKFRNKLKYSKFKT